MTTEQNRIACNKWRASHKDYYNAYDKEYKNKLHRQRRNEYMANKSCPYCGEDDSFKLVVHHLFPKDPLLEGKHSGHLWGWKESRRIIELLKCLVVCKSCHNKIHAETITVGG